MTSVRFLAAVLASLCIPVSVAFANDAATPAGSAAFTVPPAQSAPQPAWMAWGGEASFGFNPDALAAFDLRIVSAEGHSARSPGAPGKRYDGTTFPALDGGALEVLHRGKGVTGIGQGELRFKGGFVFAHAGKTVDLRGFAIRARPGIRFDLAIVDAKGRELFTADHAHYGFDRDQPDVFTLYNMNLRIAPELAKALGQPELAGHPVGSLDVRTRAEPKDLEAPAGAVCQAPLAGPNNPADITLIWVSAATGWTGWDDSIYARRCGLPATGTSNTCTTTSTTGKVVLAPDSSLRNTGTTGVAWHYKFSGSNPPYNNDQHPYLIWNLYRQNADGSIQQIGVSAVKHAFITVNMNCPCQSSPHIIYPTCEDTYSLSNNDNSSSGGNQTQNLAPRSEIIPSTAIWGRCGSMWDANCDGAMDPGSGAQDLYQQRMLVTESDMLPPLATGARYFFEYWYVVRDDSNIYNTMGYREIRPVKNGAIWQINLVDATAPDHNFFLGPFVNRWVDPASTAANERNAELVTPLGRARVAVKATDLGNGQWRYQYVVMNFDYAHVRIDPAHATEPNLKLLENHGFSKFQVPLPAGVTASSIVVADADDNAANAWTGTAADGAVTWTAPATGNRLNWGTLYRFEFIANTAPDTATVGLTGAATATEAELPYTVSLLGPKTPISDVIFANGFEP